MVTRNSERIAVVCAIIEYDSSILAAKRKKWKTNGGLWEFPGGKVNNNESRNDALLREIGEELDVSITPGRKLSPIDWDYSWISIRLYPYICILHHENRPKPIDHEEIMFVTRSEAETLDWSPADRMVLEEYWSIRQKV